MTNEKFIYLASSSQGHENVTLSRHQIMLQNNYGELPFTHSSAHLSTEVQLICLLTC